MGCRRVLKCDNVDLLPGRRSERNVVVSSVDA